MRPLGELIRANEDTRENAERKKKEQDRTGLLADHGDLGLVLLDVGVVGPRDQGVARLRARVEDLVAVGALLVSTSAKNWREPS